MTKWQGDRKETRKFMCDSRASPLKLSYIYVLRLEQFGARSSLLIEILNME